jgi:hypothetical protein
MKGELVLSAETVSETAPSSHVSRSQLGAVRLANPDSCAVKPWGHDVAILSLRLLSRSRVTAL